jgi:hypothetical protein
VKTKRELPKVDFFYLKTVLRKINTLLQLIVLFSFLNMHRPSKLNLFVLPWFNAENHTMQGYDGKKTRAELFSAWNNLPDRLPRSSQHYAKRIFVAEF